MSSEISVGIDLSALVAKIKANATVVDPEPTSGDSTVEAMPRTRVLSVVPSGTFEAPQFILQRGAELGYHCHVYRTIGNKDLGLMVTMVGNRVFVETHRVGKVKKPRDIGTIGEKEKADLIQEARYQLGSIPEAARRRPGKKSMPLELPDRS
jgi:hypothetical protein